VEVINVLKNYS